MAPAPLRLLGSTLAVATLTAVGATGASAASLYDGPPPRPGPELLYSKPTTAPQLRTWGPWQAEPILVSGASAYRDGEFLYQDFLYDDHGAKGLGRDVGDPRHGDDTFSASNGTYIYPSDPIYAQNAADLVELRVQPLERSTAFRITLNTMRAPERVAATIALGNSPAPRELPHGANARAPASHFLTVHGDEAEMLDAASGAAVTPAPAVRVLEAMKQIEVRVPKAAWNPGVSEVRMSAGVGLWDPGVDRYLVPASFRDADTPGGALGLTRPTAIFNAAFRHSEPWPEITNALEPFLDPAWWRDRAQAAALADNDLGRFHAVVDFAKLRADVDDEMAGEPAGVPRSGPMNRILSSRFDTGEGADWNTQCGAAGPCEGELRGRLQPYAIYVPEGPEPNGGYGLTLLLHSLAANYNQFADSANQAQFGERGPGSIVITPAGRGPDGWYFGHAGADTFEVWADVARRYRLDPDWTSIAGYSMGGYGTYKLAAQFPDLFARANPTVGPPGVGLALPPLFRSDGDTGPMLASLRNVPFLIWAGVADELVPVVSTLDQAQRFDRLGYRYRYDLFVPADHFALAVHDQWRPAANFLGTHEVDRNPAHVSYVVNPAMDFPELGFRANHAYWLSGLRLHDAGGDALGEIDAFSHAFGEARARPLPTEFGAGALGPGTLGSIPYVEQRREWAPPRRAPAADRLELRAENLRSVRVHVDRAGLSCNPQLDVVTDGPLTVELIGCGRSLRFG